MTRNTGPGSRIIAGISVTNNGDFHSTPQLLMTEILQTKGYDGMNKYTNRQIPSIFLFPDSILQEFKRKAVGVLFVMLNVCT